MQLLVPSDFSHMLFVCKAHRDRGVCCYADWVVLRSAQGRTFIISRDICCMVCISCGVRMRSLTIFMTSVLFDSVPATFAIPSCSVSCAFMLMKCARFMYICEMVCIHRVRVMPYN